MKKLKKNTITFTGERMIPILNKGKTLYFEHLERYLFSQQFARGKVVLDLGCGVGYGSDLLLQAGARTIEGYDISEESISYAKSLYKKIKFHIADIELPISTEEKVGLIVAFEILEHLHKQDQFLKNIKAVLKDDGIVCISTPNKSNSHHENPFHIKELTLEEFKRLMQKHFKYTYIFNQGFYFLNIIAPERNNFNEYTLVNTEVTKFYSEVYLPPERNKNTMYFIAVCSNLPISNIELRGLGTINTDEFDLSNGIEGMTKTIQIREKYVQEYKTQIEELERILNQITSSKFFKLWQSYTRIKKILLKVSRTS